VGRKIALEHAALDAERFDANIDVRLPGLGQLFRRRRRIAQFEAEPGQAHREPAKLDDDVLALRKLLDRCLPARKILLTLVLVAADADEPSAMIEDDLLVREFFRKVG